MIDLRVPPQDGFASLVGLVAGDAAARADLTAEQRSSLANAASAGFELIVREAMAAQREAIRVHATWTPRHVCISLIERGLPLDDAAARRDPGWHKILENVDRAHWKLLERGSELQLTVKRPHGVAHDGARPSCDQTTARAPEQTYTVRRFQSEDAPGVARAFYRTWGYHYIFPAVYVPHRLIALNEANEYISIVAVAQDGEIVGHYALDPVPGAPIADGCAAIVNPAHRGRGLLERMRQAAEDEARTLGFAAYYSEPVTSHARTQTDSVKFGAHLCALVLGGDPSSFVPKAMESAGAGQRQSFTVYFKPLVLREGRTIFAPPQHREIIDRIYANLGLPVELGEGNTASGCGELRVEIVRTEGYAAIDIVSAGSASADQLAQAVCDVRNLARMGAIYLNLPLEDPATPLLCTAAERLGFFFCGVIPWAMGGRDVLRLQLPLTRIDLSGVTVAGDFGAEFKSYVGAQMQAHGSSPDT